jgi:hypothetical protein
MSATALLKSNKTHRRRYRCGDVGTSAAAVRISVSVQRSTMRLRIWLRQGAIMLFDNRMEIPPALRHFLTEVPQPSRRLFLKMSVASGFALACLPEAALANG